MGKSTMRKTTHSTTARVGKNKAASKRKPKSRIIPPPPEEVCDCCPDCEGKPSGTIGVCEDDGCVDITPPTYVGIFVFDPERPGGLPYWERIQNLPAPVLQALATALAPYLP